MIAYANIYNPGVASKWRHHRIVRRPAMKAQVQRLQEAPRAARLKTESAQAANSHTGAGCAR